MTRGAGGSQPPWDEQEYPPQQYGQRYSPDQQWQPEHYDPYAHRQRINVSQQPGSGQSPGYGQPPQPASQPPHQLPPRRARRKPLRKRNVILFAIAGIFAIAVISTALGTGNGKSAKPIAAASSAASAKASSGLAQAEDACEKRPPASGDTTFEWLRPEFRRKHSS